MTGLRWWWVRHGPTHVAGAVGWTDVPADLGDTAAIARLSAALPPDAPVLSSDLARARDTATALQGTRPRLPDMAALRELNFGAWETRGFDDIARDDPVAHDAFWQTPETAAPPDGESLGDLTARVSGVIAGFNAAPPGPDVIVVAHAGVIRAALSQIAGMSTPASLAFHVAPLSLTRLDWLGQKEQWRIDRVNHVP